jgi:hypothetical protein
VAEQCHAAGVIFVFACSWIKVAQVDKFRGHFFVFASSWTKVAQADKFRGYFFGFASSWTKVAQADKLKDRQCILLIKFIVNSTNMYGTMHKWYCSLSDKYPVD